MIIYKSEAEAAKMRQAGRIVAQVLQAISEMAKPGLTTLALDARALELTVKMGVQPAFKGYRGFPAALCTSLNEEVVHGIPGPRRLAEGDILSLDFGVIYEGYYGDAAVTIPIGKVSPQAMDLMEVTRASLYQGIAAACVGKRISAIGRAVQSYVEARGFSVVQDFAGHGIGQEMHEDPHVPNFVRGFKGYDAPFRAGMTIAIEPMVNIGTYQVVTKPDNWTVFTKDGSLSAHYEHTILVTEGEPEILTLM